MSKSWQWESDGSDWGVEIKEEAGVLSWWGADKPRPGVPYHALGGGGQDQPIAEFLRTGRGPYPCPEPILSALKEALEHKTVT